ncbi:glycerophosphoryl diester phosphodiesterase membrane domain-containing protein [Streptococcus constellatus]|uniref:glycerophosphoryl diester phosphodiesterase membrane domain-containing protein n=1 Tax=Streptococcus constellatus TaxID=76860 RepID=UPI002000D0A3|nr:glycerophosphodiester phosphodiesterase [Streptococcus constellatus]
MKQRLDFHKLYYNLDKILFLFFIIFMVMEYLWLPFNSWAADSLLRLTGYQFLSYNNVLAVLSSNLLLTLAFIVLFLVNLLVAYFQVGLLFLGAHNLLTQQGSTLFAFTKKTVSDGFSLLKQVRPSKVAFVLLYIGLLFPFIRKILKIYYLNKILIPNFIVSYLRDTYFLAGIGLALLVLLMLLIAVRLMFALPKILIENVSVREAVRFSLEKTHKRLLFYSWHLFWIVTKSFLLFFAITIPLLCLQTYTDGQSNQTALIAGVVNYVLMKTTHYLMLTYFLVKFVAFLTEKRLCHSARRKLDRLYRWVVMSIAFLAFAAEGYSYLQIPLSNNPAVISHRGVSQANGVQNTIQSLEKTALLKPDYIEMDVQETKDGQFVMMHDTNLSALTGVNAKPQDLTLTELTALDVTENGYRTKISSFDAYLKRANELGQRLLIEIKTSKKDSPDMMDRFLNKYGNTIKQYGHQMHSLDYKVINKVVKYDASIPTFFILPYNTIFPRTKASGYTMEYSTLDDNFIFKLWQTDKKLYDWTVNDENAISKSLRLGVDGIITDDVQLVQTAIKELQNNPKYTDLLINQAFDFFNFT